jgi:hypothetical protein
MKTKFFALPSVFFLLISGIFMTTPARGYIISAELEGNTVGGSGITYMFSKNNGIKSLSNNLTDKGPAGNFVDGYFDINLATGQIKTYTESYGPEAGQYAWSGSLKVKGSMQDTLYFRIPPGTYSMGLQITIHGRISGTIMTEGNTSYNEAGQSAGVSFANSVYTTGWRSSSFSDPFSLSYMLVNPGEIFYFDTVRSANVAVSGEGYSKMWSNDGGRALANFGNTISITSLELPGEISSWYSDSGVFLSKPVVDIRDAILAMQVVSRITPAQIVHKAADVDGDGKIGLAEAIFILQKVADIR